MTRQHASPCGMVIVILARLACDTTTILYNFADILAWCWKYFIVRWMPHSLPHWLMSTLFLPTHLHNSCPEWIVAFLRTTFRNIFFFQEKGHESLILWISEACVCSSSGLNVLIYTSLLSWKDMKLKWKYCSLYPKSIISLGTIQECSHPYFQ